jgi:hypothetical protein
MKAFDKLTDTEITLRKIEKLDYLTMTQISRRHGQQPVRMFVRQVGEIPVKVEGVN